jgi:hypothetical protein
LKTRFGHGGSPEVIKTGSEESLFFVMTQAGLKGAGKPSLVAIGLRGG